jgi:beta-N-acetylhexosaminidase
MTDLRSLVHSVVVPGFAGTTLPPWLADRLTAGLAGVCLFGHNVADAAAVRDLDDAVHAAREAALVLSDEEGGEVTRLDERAGSPWPGHAALGRVDDPEATRQVAAAVGRQARAAGIDVVLAPVVDVNSDPENPVIGLRSFGDSPDLAARHGAAFVAGLQSAGVAACAKHYPGHGATRTDSHLSLPTVDADAETLRRRDLAPFGAAVRAGARCVMTAHVVFPALDDRPATMSPRLLGLLRAELGFDGVVISDALDMKAVSQTVGRAAGAVRALASGVDLVCIGNPCFPERYDAEKVLDEVVDALVRAVETGEVQLERLEHASARVAALAAWAVEQRSSPDASAAGGGDDLDLARDVAARAVEQRGTVRLTAPPLVLRAAGAPNMAAGPRPSRLVEELCRREPATRAAEVASVEEARACLASEPGRPVVVAVGPRRAAHVRPVVDAVLAARPDAVVVYTGLPEPTDAGSNVVHTYGNDRSTAAAATDLLLGEHAR